MSLISRVIKSLINGISYQAPSVRLDNQVEDQVNMIPDISGVLTRRSPVRLDDIIDHDDSRDYSEEHAMFTVTIREEPVSIGITPEGIVYRFDENFATTVIQQSATVTSYLSYTDKNDLSAIETSDKLIILNRGIEVTLDLSSYTNQKSLDSTITSSININTFSDTRDACYIVGVDTATELFNTSAMNGKAVIWNSDYTEFQLYEQDATKLTIQQSPQNAISRKCYMVKYVSSTLVDTTTSTWRDSLPNKILVEPTYSMKATPINLPYMYDTTSGSKWYMSIDKEAGSTTNTMDIFIGTFTDNDALSSGTYGYWNDDGDTLDISSYTYTRDGQVYSATLESDSGTTRTYYMKAVLDKNRPSYVSGLPVKITGLDDSFDPDFQASWIVTPDGVDATNTEVYKYTDGVGTYFATLTSGTIGGAVTQIDLSYTGAGTKTINAGNEPEQLPSENRSVLSSLQSYYGDLERLHIGWCVSETGGGLTGDYTVVHQENTTAATSGKISLGVGLTATIIEKDYDTLVDAIESKTEFIEDSPNTLSIDKYIRGKFIYSLAVLGGRADVYSYYTKTIRDTEYSRSLIWITSAINGATYKVFWYDYNSANKLEIASETASGTSTPKSLITAIVADMTSALTGTKLATFYQENNTVIVRGKTMGYLEVECDYGNYIHTVVEARPASDKVITDASILPAKISTTALDCLTPTGSAESNFLVKVNADINEPLNNHYLIYSSDYDAWVETTDGYIDSIDKTTMPVSINKTTPDSIIIEHSTIVSPEVGDNTSNASPSFIGKTIKDILLFNSRMGYASEDTLVFSVIDDIFNLYRTSTAKVLISDVVDLELDSSKLGYRKIVNVFTLNNNLMINTGLSQSMLALPQNLDISAAIFAQVSSFDLGSRIPTPIRRALYFPIKQGSFTNIKAFEPDIETGSGFTDNSVTKHCEKLIRGTIIQSLFVNDTFLARTDEDPKTLYVQNTYVSEGVILQNAWHKWTFKYNIKYIYSTGETLKLIFEDIDNSQTIYGTLQLNPSEITEDVEGQIGYFPYLDYYTSDTTLAARLSGTLSIDTSLGKKVAVGTEGSIQGNTFESKVVLSEIIPKQNDGQGGSNKIGYALLMLRRMALTLGLTGRLTISVSRTKRTVYSHNFIPELLGNIVVGREPVSTREAKFPINGRAQDVEVTISTVDTFTPLQIISLEWQGQLIQRGGR